MFRVFVFVFVLNGAFCEPLSFKGHKVVRIVPQTTREVTFLQAILKDKTDIDVWKPPSAVNVPVDLRLSPLNYDDVIQNLRNGGSRPSLLIDNVQDMADNQVASRQQPRFKLMTLLGDFDYSSYHTYDEILVWMENITRVHSDKAELFMVTDSYEGRPLMGIKINSEPEVEKPGFYFEGGIHAREWISPATMIYMTAQMLYKYGIDPDITAMVDQFEWYIVPVANPDGYAYTWTDNRFWRKTRSLNNGSSCIGTDPNRNWNFAWCEPGATSNPCSDNYCGSAPFSEVEIRGISDFIKGKTNMKAFIDFHSYSQLWMSPWAFTDAELPPDVILQNEGSVVAVEALQKVHGTEFENGPIGTVLYVASGSSIDWAYGAAEIIFSYAVELRDKGQFGFLLPSDQILPSGEETLQALRALANYVYGQ